MYINVLYVQSHITINPTGLQVQLIQVYYSQSTFGIINTAFTIVKQVYTNSHH